MSAHKVALPQMPRSMALVLAEVAAKHGVSVASLFDRSRMAMFVWPRHEFMVRANAQGFSCSRIARWFGLNHTTVSDGIRSHHRRAERGLSVYKPPVQARPMVPRCRAAYREQDRASLSKARSARTERIAHQKALAFALLAEGKRQSEASRILKVTPRTMWRWVKEMRSATA